MKKYLALLLAVLMVLTGACRLCQPAGGDHHPGCTSSYHGQYAGDRYH